MNNIKPTHRYIGWQQWLFWALWLLGLVMAGYTFIGTAMALLSLPLMGMVLAAIFIMQVVMLVLSAIRFFKHSHTMRRLFAGLGWGVFAPIIVFFILNIIWATQHYGS